MNFLLLVLVCFQAVFSQIPSDILELSPWQYEGAENNTMSFINKYNGIYQLNNSNFYVEDGAVVFRTFTNGASIPGTNARTELDEISYNNFGYWPVSLDNVLVFEGKITHCDSPRQRFVFSQIWIANNYWQLVYDRGTVVLYSTSLGSNEPIVPVYRFGDHYAVVFSCVNAVVSVSIKINEIVYNSIKHPISSTLKARFKFGSYISVDKPLPGGSMDTFCEN